MTKIIENYVLENVLGAGQFGKVFKGKNTKDNNYYAIKSIKRQIFDDNPKLKEFTVNEIHTLTKIDNEHVVKFIEMIKTNNNFYFVYEFCNGGTLEDDLYSRGYFTEREAKPIFQQIVKGLDSVTKLNIIHRDLKPQNILYHNGKIKIADFGFCKPLQSKNQLTKTVLGSPIYMAPEILRGDDYTMKADIWSLGVLFYEMLFGKCPYEGKSIANLINLIDDTDLVFHENHQISETMRNLLREMLCKDPQRRIEWDRIYDIVMEKNTIPKKMIEEDSIYSEMKKPFPHLNVSIPQGSPKKFDHQCISLDNTPSIELNAGTFNQTILNLNTEQTFNKPKETSYETRNQNFYKTENPNSFKPDHNSVFAKEQTFITPTNNYNALPSENSTMNSNPMNQMNYSANQKNPLNHQISSFENNSSRNNMKNEFKNENYSSGVKNRDSLHSSFHKHEKSELVFSKVYKIEIKHAIFNIDALLKFITKERNKLYFLSKVFYELSLYKLMSTPEAFEINFHKYLYFHAKNFKEILLEHISLDVVNVIANYNDLCNTYEYKIVKELFKEEMDKIINAFMIHKEKAQLNKNIKNIDKIEMDSTNYINLKNFYKHILEYIVLVKENFLFSKEEKYKSEDSLKYMIHVIEMLDSVLLNELFDNFIEEEENFDNQKYFINLRKSKFTGLLKILNQKIDYFKKKYIQE